MSNTSSIQSLKQFLVLVSDFPGRLQARVVSTAAHLEGALPKINSGDVSHSGVTLGKHAVEEREPLDINGSFFVMKAESEQALRDLLEEDTLTKGGVWDVQNAKVFPCKAG